MNPSHHSGRLRVPASAFEDRHAMGSALVNPWSSWIPFVVGVAKMEGDQQGYSLGVRFPQSFVLSQSREG